MYLQPMGGIHRKGERAASQKAIYFAKSSLSLQRYLHNLFVFYKRSFLSLRAHLHTIVLVTIDSEIAICCPRADVKPQISCYGSLLHVEKKDICLK